MAPFRRLPSRSPLPLPVIFPIHPFRDGNGRCARLLATLMAMQAGLPPLDFGNLEGKGKARYFDAIQAALGRDYEPLTSILRATIDRSLRSAARAPRA